MKSGIRRVVSEKSIICWTMLSLRHCARRIRSLATRMTQTLQLWRTWFLCVHLLAHLVVNLFLDINCPLRLRGVRFLFFLFLFFLIRVSDIGRVRPE